LLDVSKDGRKTLFQMYGDLDSGRYEVKKGRFKPFRRVFDHEDEEEPEQSVSEFDGRRSHSFDVQVDAEEGC
jgi:hypothetical protein